MVVNQLYKHDKSTDVVFRLYEQYNSEQGDLFCTVGWINITNLESLTFIGMDKIIIKKNKVGEWKKWLK